MTGNDTSRDGAADPPRAEGADGAADVAPAAADDPKARFKAALDKKNAAAHRSNQGSANTGAVHGSESTGPGKRMFRRKSGG